MPLPSTSKNASFTEKFLEAENKENNRLKNGKWLQVLQDGYGLTNK